MKICAAQAKPVLGDIKNNIARHLTFIDEAAAMGAGIIIFPELSLTGYEPTLAQDLAIHVNDDRLDIFQEKSNTINLVIAVGAPLQMEKGVGIGMIIFQPHHARLIYTKKFLHTDEIPFFVPGTGGSHVRIGNKLIAFAICYELSVPAHALNASRKGADIYLACVAKTVDGIKKAHQDLSIIAAKYSMDVVVCNAVGYSDNFESAGQSAAWDKNGKLLLQLNKTQEDLLIVEIA